MRKNNGFSMVELLIAVVILVALIGATITFINPLGQLGKARNAQRKSDLNQYRIALESYATANDSYYTRRTARQTASTRPCDVLEPVFMNSCPDDPGHNPGASPDDNYRYRTNGTCSGGEACATDFVLWTYLEGGGIWEVCGDGRAGKLEIDPPNLPDDANGNCEVTL